MKVKIIVVETGEKANALIREGAKSEIPSLHDEWYFDLAKQLKRLPNATGYILVKEDTPSIVEGCMIFQLMNKEQPVMAYLEVAPHNRVIPKKHDNVAGCLIAFACKQSVIRGVGHYQGVLHFWVGEERKEDEQKLIDLYKTKYHAVQLGNSPLLQISDEASEQLIRKYIG
ncbi:MAG: hypothetical protein EOP48_00265 [Sphingobacteriales bacterium]|nr:MAG: hypothetical protein EOP48_00265 [Sphingobacteriales bacterium]